MIGIILLGFFGLILLAGGAVLGLYAWRNQRTASLLGRPLSRVGKLRPGYRRIRGKVAALGKPLQSPATNKACVYYRLRVYEDRRTWVPTSTVSGGLTTAGFLMIGGAGGTLYAVSRLLFYPTDDTAVQTRHVLLDKEVSIPLAVEDDTASVEVDLRGATIRCKEKSVLATTRLAPVLAVTRLTELLMEEHGIYAVDERGNYKALEFVEEVLLVDAKVTVAGPVEPGKSGELCFRKKDDPLLVIQGDMGKETEDARSQAMGFVIGSTSSLVVGLGCLLGFFFLIVRKLLA